MEEEWKKVEKSLRCHTHRGLSVFKILPQNYAFILKHARKSGEKFQKMVGAIVPPPPDGRTAKLIPAERLAGGIYGDAENLDSRHKPMVHL